MHDGLIKYTRILWEHLGEEKTITYLVTLQQMHIGLKTIGFQASATDELNL